MSFPNRCFYIVAVDNLALVMGTTLPTSLYSLYRTTFNLDPILITVIYSVYPIVVIPALFLLGPLGDKYGRKPVLLVATVIGMISLLILGFARDLVWLLVGRALQGLALGVASGNATAALVEFEPNENRKRANIWAGASLFSGLVLGPLAAGVMGRYLPHPLLLSYLATFALEAVTFVFLFSIPEEHEKPFNAPSFYKPALPKGKVAVFLSSSVAGGLVFAMFAVTIFHLSLVAIRGKEIKFG